MEPGPIDAPLASRLLDGAPVGFVVVSSPGTITWANPTYFEVTGRSRDLVGRDFHELPERDGTWSEEVGRAIDACLATGAASTFSSVRARYRDPSRPVYLDVEIRRLPAVPGGPAEAVVLVQDVTDREAERQRASLFYAAFQASTNAMQLTDSKGIMIDVNPAYERIYGYSRSECIGRAPNLVRSRYTPPEVYEQLWRDLLDPSRGYWSGEILNRDRKGRERPVLLSITALREGDGPATHYLGVAVDLSEKRRWELGAAHAEKLASLGQLAAGVAHEINTPLANVVLIAESIRRKHADPWLQSRLERMTDQVEVAAGIVRGLLDFARREPPRPAPLDLVSVVQASLEFLRGKQSSDVEIDAVYPPEGAPVIGDRGQLMQVMTNLLNNAYDAMHGRGRIRLTVSAEPTRIEVEIADTGPGIAEEALPHLFEPFFTTKPEGSGTGLGLAICHGILQSHHGSIRAANAPGGGAVFRISLPRREDPGERPREPLRGTVPPG